MNHSYKPVTARRTDGKHKAKGLFLGRPNKIVSAPARTESTYGCNLSIDPKNNILFSQSVSKKMLITLRLYHISY